MSNNAEILSILWHHAILCGTWEISDDMMLVDEMSRLGVQRYTMYQEYHETAVQDMYHDMKKLIKICILTWKN